MQKNGRDTDWMQKKKSNETEAWGSDYKLMDDDVGVARVVFANVSEFYFSSTRKKRIKMVESRQTGFPVFFFFLSFLPDTLISSVSERDSIIKHVSVTRFYGLVLSTLCPSF